MHATRAPQEKLSRSRLLRRMPWEGPDAPDWAPLLDREWLVTNGLGGYASGTVSGAATRRYHGLLIAALPAPLGRTMMLEDLAEVVRVPGGEAVRLGGEENPHALTLHGARYLAEFRLDAGLPVWTYRIGDRVIEKRLVMPHEQNTTAVQYALLEGEGAELELRPLVHFRSHDAPVDRPLGRYEARRADARRLEIAGGDADLPPLRVHFEGHDATFEEGADVVPQILYRVEASRGYASVGDLWTPGRVSARLEPGRCVGVVVSTEPWDTMPTPTDPGIETVERERRSKLLQLAPESAREGLGAELVLAADQFIIVPATRAEDEAMARAAGSHARSVIAGYHWFTDWGRDTMIALEGLTLATGRHREAGEILRTFGRHMKDGLIPNLFPEGGREGLYHTADATLWFFHAVHRHRVATGQDSLLEELLPRLSESAQRHIEGTRFGIGVDPADGLLRQGAEGYQLTWMDAKVDDWVVTPRRGKAVEINALWYNALRLLEGWLREAGDTDGAEDAARHAERCRASFNDRFWYADGGYLYDVVDGERGDDPALRPNQLLAISLDHAVLQRERWEPVLRCVEASLLTRVGLRSLAPGQPDYQPRYFGPLRSRDAAYHQGTVWGWLIGPFIDAWIRAHPDEPASTARRYLAGLAEHMDEFCIGSLAEIYDAEEPHTPRGCIAQAWSVAEALRCWVATAP